VDVFTALADPVRRALLRRLVDGPARVVDLAAEQDVSRPAISKHLRALTETGLVRGETRGRERHYRLAPEGLDEVQQLLDDLARPPVRFTEAALDALELEVRRTGRERRSRPTPRHTNRSKEETG
jgi:DNA-binding transcriptional ArsR family regulator